MSPVRNEINKDTNDFFQVKLCGHMFQRNATVSSCTIKEYLMKLWKV